MKCKQCSHDREYHGWLENSDGAKRGICASPPGDCDCDEFVADPFDRVPWLLPARDDLVAFTADMEQGS